MTCRFPSALVLVGRGPTPAALRRAATLVALLAAVVVTGAGCVAVSSDAADGDGSGVVTGSAATTPPASPGGVDPRLPLDRYLLAPRESELVAQAFRTLVGQCMRGFGITSPQGSSGQQGPATRNERRYGITDPRLAATDGYRLANQTSAAVPARPRESADPRARQVLTGMPAGTVNGHPVLPEGCAGEARLRLNKGAPGGTDPDTAMRLAQDSFFESERDPRVRAVVRAWSDCMRRHGHNYPTPLAAAADPRFRGAVSPTEIAVATTDITCKTETDLVGVWSSVETEVQRPVVESNRPALENIRRTNEIQLAAARGLGSGSRPG